jgi:hypothetical protein
MIVAEKEPTVLTKLTRLVKTWFLSVFKVIMFFMTIWSKFLRNQIKGCDQLSTLYLWVDSNRIKLVEEWSELGLKSLNGFKLTKLG